MKKMLIGIMLLSLLVCSIGLVTAVEQKEEYTVINAPLSPVGGKFAHLIPSGSVIYHSADGITTVYTAEGKRILKAKDSDAALVPAGFGSVPATKVHYVPNGSRFTIEPSKFYTADRGWIAGNTTKAYAPDGTLVLTVIHEKCLPREEAFATKNHGEEYVVITAPITPTEGKGPNHVPPGSLIYHSNDGITTAYAPDGKIIWKARDSDAAAFPVSGIIRNGSAVYGPGHGKATRVIMLPNGSRSTHGPIKFYTEDRGWIVGNATKSYGPDGRLLIIGTSEKRTKIVKTLTTENLSAEEMVKITNHVPPGSLVYHSDDGITLVYAPDGKIIVKARDFDAKTVPMSGLIPVPGRNITAREPKWATLVSAVSAVPNCTHIYEPFKFYTEDRGWIIGNAVKSYGPDGTLLLIGTSEKRTTCEKTVEIQKLGDSEFSGVLERTEDHVNTLDEFTAYWDCPSAPPSPNPDVSVLLFNAVQDYTDWGRVMQPILCWSTENGFWNAYSMWGPDEPEGDFYPAGPAMYVDVGDKLKGEIKWDDTAGCWHVCLYNLDKGTTSCVDSDVVGDNAELDIFTVLEAPAPYHVSDFTDLPGDTTFYDMSLKSQGTPVDIEWVKNVNSTAKGLIPELDVIVYSDSKVKLVTRKEIKPLDVILVTDRSGSMSGTLSDAKTAAKTFVDQLSGQDKVGLVSFNDCATLDRHLTSDFDDVKNVIDGYSADGWTNIGDALTEAINELETNGRADSIPVIILLSDGGVSAGPSEEEILNTIVPQAVSAGITIYTFGYDEANEDFLTQVATAASGEYHFEPDSAALTAIYTHLSQSMQPEEEYEGSVAQDETAEETNWLDKIIDFFKIILHWEGSDLDLTLIDPNGTVIEPGMPGVIYSGNDTYPEYYEIHNPMKGNWTIQIYGKNVTGEYEDYTVTVFHPGASMYVKPTKWDINYPTNKTIIFNVSETGGMNDLINVTFTASDLVEVDTGAAAARKGEREARLEAERKMEFEKQVEGQEEGKETNSTQVMSLLHLPQEWISRLIEKLRLSHFLPEPVSSESKSIINQSEGESHRENQGQNQSQKLSGSTIPASSFSFSLNNFNVTAGGSQDVTATLTVPPGTPPGNYSGTIDVTSDNGNSATITVTITYVGFGGTVRVLENKTPHCEQNWTITLPPGDVVVAYVHWHRWGACPNNNPTAEFWNGNGQHQSISIPDSLCSAGNNELRGVWYSGYSPDNGNHHYYWRVNATPGTNIFRATGCYDTPGEHCDDRWFFAVISNTDTPNTTHTGVWWHNYGYKKATQDPYTIWFYNASIDPVSEHNYSLWVAQSHYGDSDIDISINNNYVGTIQGPGGYPFSLYEFNVPSDYLDTDGSQEVTWDMGPPDDYFYVYFATLAEKAVLNLSDLVVKDIMFPEVMNPNISYTIKARIKNRGDASAGLFNVSLWTDGSLHSKVIGIGPLSAGANTTVIFPGVSLSEGCHNFTVMADCDTDVYEGAEVAPSETNNARTEYYQVGHVIVVHSNSDLQSKADRVEDGTYYIENWTITNCVGCGITIENTNLPFVIQNCTVHNCNYEQSNPEWNRYKAGIYLRNVTNGKIRGNTIENNTNAGIRVKDSTHVEIMDNYIRNNSVYGIHVCPEYMVKPPYPEYVKFINITNNTVIGNQEGIDLVEAFNCTVNCNTVRDNMKYGIYVCGNYSCIYNNEIKNNNVYGMKLFNASHNLIFWNNFIDNNRSNPGYPKHQAYDNNGYNQW